VQLNPSKPFVGIFSLLVVVYVVFVLLTSDPLLRMNRICQPVTLWPSRVVVSAVRIWSPGNVPGVQDSFNRGFFTCRKWVWGVLYRDDYMKLKADSDAAPASATSTPAEEAR